MPLRGLAGCANACCGTLEVEGVSLVDPPGQVERTVLHEVVESFCDVVVQNLNGHWSVEETHQISERGPGFGEQFPRDCALVTLAGVGVRVEAGAARDCADGNGSSVWTTGTWDDDSVANFDLAYESPYLCREAGNRLWARLAV